jgi:hypothetical protein
VCEPVDVPVNKRHLDMVYSHLRYSDKAFMGSVTHPSRAADSIEMARLVFGADVVDNNCVIMGNVNVNSPLVWDATMTGALKTYAAANQAPVVVPFILGGAMGPVTTAGAVAQAHAETLVGIAPRPAGSSRITCDLRQLPVVHGVAQRQSDVRYARTGARFAGRRSTCSPSRLPLRCSGAFTSSKVPDGQAMMESAVSMMSALLCGANFILHAAGWLEGGLAMGYEKFMMDLDLCGAAHTYLKGFDLSEDQFAQDGFAEIGPGKHFFSAQHTLRHYETAFLRTGAQRLVVVRAVARRRRANQRRSRRATRPRGAGALRTAADRRRDRFRVDRLRRTAQSFDARPVVLTRRERTPMSLAIDIPAPHRRDRSAQTPPRPPRQDPCRAGDARLRRGVAERPMNIRYATDTHTFNVWTLHAPGRYVFVPVDGPVVLFEYGTCLYQRHRSRQRRRRSASRCRGSTSWPVHARWRRPRLWSRDIIDLMRKHGGADQRLAVDRCEPWGARHLTDAGIQLFDAQEPLENARMIKTPEEIQAMQLSMDVCDVGVDRIRQALQPGLTENELWALLHEANIAHDGEWIECRLLVSGPAHQPVVPGSRKPQGAGRGTGGLRQRHGRASRLPGRHLAHAHLPGKAPTAEQRKLYDIAQEQILTNIELIKPGPVVQGVRREVLASSRRVRAEPLHDDDPRRRSRRRVPDRRLRRGLRRLGIRRLLPGEHGRVRRELHRRVGGEEASSSNSRC